MDFINLRNYSENSILNATIFPKDLIKKHKEAGLKAVALTDTKGYGMINFFNGCISEGIKPLYGFNVKSQGILHNIILFPKSDIGRNNIFKIVTEINIEKANGLGKYKNNKEILKDIIVIVDYNTYKQFPDYYSNIIDKENLFIELQPRNTENDYNDLIQKVGIDNIIITSPLYYLDEILSREVEIIKGENGEDIEQENFKLTGEDSLRLMKSIESGVPFSEIKGDFSGLYFKTKEQIKEEFSFIKEDNFEKILTNISNIVDNINFNLTLGVPQIPVFEIEGEAREIYDKNKDKSPSLNSDEWYLRYLVYSKIGERYDLSFEHDDMLELIHKEYDFELEKKLSEYSIDEIKKLSKEHFSSKKIEIYKKFNEKELEIMDRIEYELLIIHKMGFDAYFLIVSDYINYSKDIGDIVGPGRGSAAGSIVVYITGITDIDPIKYELLFERFLNSGRISLPDIDTDFSNKDPVIKYCSDKYGADHVAPVITFSKMTAKTILKGVGKSIGVGYQEVNRISAKVTKKEQTGHASLETIYEENDDFRKEIDSSSEYTKMFKMAKGLEGLKQGTSTHACAVIIAPNPITDYCPLQFPTDKQGNIKEKNKYLTQLEGGDLEAQGLLKMDFLGLDNLTVIKNTLELIEKHHGKKIDMLKIDTEDQDVYKKIFHNGNTTNVFQFESPGMKKYLKKLKPTAFDDLIAMVSLYRPGPMQFIDTYIGVKHGTQTATYKDSDLEGLLGVTHSVCIYQEQIMKMAQTLAGYTLGEADLLRRAIGKKKKKIILEQREVFCKKGEKLGKDPSILGEIYDDIVLPAAEYSFNKSHAAAYAFISYQTAYLKAYYPNEFTIGNLMMKGDDLDRVKITIEDALLNNIKILPLDINQSGVDYEHAGNMKLRMGLKVIKGVGEKILVDVIKDRDKFGKYKSFDDFFERNKELMNKKLLNGLLSSGAIESLIETNKGFLNIDRILAAKKALKKTSKGQSNLFSLFDEEIHSEGIIEYSEPEEIATPYTKAILELGSIGIMLKHHHFDGIKTFIEGYEQNRDVIFKTKILKDIKRDDLKVKLLGIATDIRHNVGKGGKKSTSFKLIGTDYIINVNVASIATHKFYGEFKNAENQLIEIEGYFSISSYGRGIFLDKNNIEFKDLNKAFKVAKGKGKYIEEEKCSWKDIYDFKEQELYYKKPINIKIDYRLEKKENLEEYKSKLIDFKSFLERNSDLDGEYEIMIKDSNGTRETKMIISSIERLKNYINGVSGFTIDNLPKEFQDK